MESKSIKIMKKLKVIPHLLLAISIFHLPIHANIQKGSYEVNKCYKYKDDGYSIEKDIETCEDYTTTSVETKGKAYTSCTKYVGAFSFTQTVKLNKTKYKYQCKVNT
jgi:hypothetical protein